MVLSSAKNMFLSSVKCLTPDNISDKVSIILRLGRQMYASGDQRCIGVL